MDQAENWEGLSAAQRSAIKSQYSAAGIKLMVSAFGSTEQPTTSGTDPIATANTMADWVIQYGLDGIDVDYEVRYKNTSRELTDVLNFSIGLHRI